MSDNYLANVPEQSMFILANGTRIANLDELFFIVRNSDDSLYTMYVNNEKNDFANWIRYSIHHEQLYNRIKGNIPKKDFIDILAQEIEFIKNPKLRETAQYFSADENSINAQDKSVIKDTGTNLKLGESIHPTDLSFENITLLTPPGTVVVAVVHPKIEKEPEVAEVAAEIPAEPEVIGKGKVCL